jgi:hypothetical protein
VALPDPPGDVTDIDFNPATDAQPFVDIERVELDIDQFELSLTIETTGSFPASLATGEEMWWALELEPISVQELSLYRITIKLIGPNWEVWNYDFEHDGELLDLVPTVAGNSLSISIPLSELSKVDGPFRWYAVAIWGGLLGSDSYGDRAPDGDPVVFPEGAGDAAPTYESLPEVAAPGNLGAVRLPDDAEAVADLIGRLPNEVAGLERSTEYERPATGEHRAVYGVTTGEAGDLSIAIHLAVLDAQGTYSDWSPETTGRDVVAFFAGGFIGEVEAAGRDGGMGWVRTRGMEPGTDREVFGLVWAQADSRWYFSAVADSPEHLDALIDAFVTTATGNAMSQPAPTDGLEDG